MRWQLLEGGAFDDLADDFSRRGFMFGPDEDFLGPGLCKSQRR